MGMFFGQYLVQTDEQTAADRGMLASPIRAHVWVRADSPEQAEALSLAYMEKYNLIPVERTGVWNSQDLPLQQLGTGESLLYRRALQYGIAVDLVSASVDDRSNLSSVRPWKS